MKWSAVILAGGRLSPSLARLTQKTYQAELSFRGIRCLDYVIQVCKEAGLSEIVVSAPPCLHTSHQGVQWVNSGDTVIQTAFHGAETVQDAEALLFLPCDVPLLVPEHIRAFMGEVEGRAGSLAQPWVALGLSPRKWVRCEFPGAPYRFLRFTEGAFSAGALYAASLSALRQVREFLLSAGERRKSLPRLLRLVGWRNAFRYLVRKISLDEADAFTQKLWGVRTIIVRNCHPFLTMDCDTVADYRYLLDYLK